MTDTTRRMFIAQATGVTLAGVAAVNGFTAPASAAAPGFAPPGATGNQSRQKLAQISQGKRSANGWEIENVVDAGGAIWTRPVPGTGLQIAVRIGDVETVLVHVVRRFHYEIATLERGEVVGYAKPDGIYASMPDSNHSSGTAVSIRSDWYPPGVSGGFLSYELPVIRDVLADCEGTVRWGGDDKRPYEAQFYLDVPPGDEKLARVAAKITEWTGKPGAGAGSNIDVLSPRRRAAAEQLEQLQRKAA